ncbi:aryl-alcohol dehydrogenase-like predicted oxidoreductase [Catalinimonas alkaloidigena]|uniref:aldo/keto reductase n=1 Tax=Catalinimonas alkaloidigena TaxID=1075417 RepID=UPI002406320B|nr:aldo/keto reductase [Catalinimonas alkaloidigena]MDF9796477.1 aryl-alcohol dehydrogenase-like predicted oxidoreductase [Catalinimonas alkaloidigena]
MATETIQRPKYQTDINFRNPLFDKGSRLVYGTSGLGGVWGKVDEEESIACLHYAFEHGISALDTSPSYNKSEEFVGKALSRWQGEHPFVSTKVGRLPAEKADECYVDYSAESMKNSLMRSLDRLGVGQLDLLFLHEPHLVPLEKIDEILDTLKAFQAEGYTKLLGVGGNPTDAFRPYITKDNFQVVSGFLKMDACNLSAFAKDIAHFRKEGVAYYAASALHMALLGTRFETYKADPPNNEWITNLDIETAKAVHKIAEQHHMPLASLAQRYLFSINEADRIVMGARKISQIQSTVEDWEQGLLSQELFEEITKTILHTRKEVAEV